jgi:hypothetical protein
MIGRTEAGKTHTHKMAHCNFHTDTDTHVHEIWDFMQVESTYLSTC